MSPLSAAAAAAAAAGRVALSGSGVSGVLLASNLNDEVGSTAIAALSQWSGWCLRGWVCALYVQNHSTIAEGWHRVTSGGTIPEHDG